jgi:hypothetical protein
MPTVTSQNKASFDQSYLNKNVPAAKPADRWKDVPFDPLQIYKVDYKTGKRESLPFIFDTATNIAQFQRTGEYNPRFAESVEPSAIHAFYDAQKLNPNLKVTPEDLVTLLAQEGRSNFGAIDAVSGYQQNKDAVALANQLRDMGYNKYDAGRAALMLDKQMTAKRLGVPWQATWNARKGYQKEYEMNAKNVGANKEALEIIRQHMSEPR